MSSDDSVWNNLKPLSHDFDYMSYLDQVEIATTEAPKDVEQLCAKVERKRSRTFFRGESSTSQQQPKREDPVAGLIKNLKDRIYRRQKEDMIEDMIAHLTILKIKVSPRPDLQEIMEKTKAIENDYKEACKKAADSNSDIATMKAIEEQYKRKLVEVVIKELEKLKERRKGSKKPNNLQAGFANNEFPRIVSGETATKRPTTTVNDQGSLGDRQQLQATFIDLQRQLNAEENNIVDVSDYLGLKEALEKTPGGETPGHLKLIADRIQEARGEATKFPHYGAQVLVSSAIKEMEDLPLETWKWGTLKKWGATLNMAKQQGFQVDFAAKLLQKNLYAYVAHSFME